MYDREQMKVALGKLAWDKVLAILATADQLIDRLNDQLVEDVVRTGCLIKKHATIAQRAHRDAFRDKLRSFIEGEGDVDLLSYLDLHIVDCHRIECAYVTILSSIEACDISKRSYPEQVWGVVRRTIAEIQLVHEKLGSFVGKSSTVEGVAFISPMNVKIEDESGGLINADGLLNSLIRAMGSSIKLLAHRADLIHGKRIVLPPPIPSDAKREFEAIAHHYYAQAWDLIEEGSEHVRYFDEELTLEDNGMPVGNADRQELLIFNISLTNEVVFRTARLRLDQQILQNSLKLSRIVSLDIRDPRHEVATFDANIFVSKEEADALLSVLTIFNYPALSTKLYGGLTIREWIRAYAVLEKCFARDTTGIHHLELVKIDRDELTNTLMRASIPTPKADIFIKALTFSMDKLDIYDAPFLEDKNGGLHFFSPAYAGVSLPHIIFSQFSSQGIQVYGKGKLFEEEVRQMFREAKVRVAGFKYWVGEQEFDCDAAVLWGDRLFIFECKNYSLPTGRASDDFYFIKKLEDAADQVKRIGKQLMDDPSILHKELGAHAQWKEVHLIVLNAMPVSFAPAINGVYFYDASALGKFLREKEISILIDPASQAISGQSKRIATMSLWRGDTPEAEDLIHQLEDPIQLKLVKGKLIQDWRHFQLSHELIAVLPQLKSEPITPEEMLEAMGHTPASVAAVMDAVAGQLNKDTRSVPMD